jgi:hypothetical protein
MTEIKEPCSKTTGNNKFIILTMVEIDGSYGEGGGYLILEKAGKNQDSCPST